ncbi:MAG: invasion associated locus B family protein [Arenicellales bacterium WSBS_2016_MAG_OTU3]
MTAQEKSSDKAPDKEFKNWAMRCGEVDASKEGEKLEKCYLFQNLLIKETGERLFQAAVGYSLFHDNPLFLMTAPLGMYLPGGIRTQVDDKEPRKTIVERCNPAGCHAAMSMNDDIITELKEGRWMNISILDGNLQEIKFKVSLVGFTAGFKAVSTATSR